MVNIGYLGNNRELRIFISILLSIGYALLFSQLDLSMFKDLNNYVIYINTLEYRKFLILENGIIFYEPLFYLITTLLNVIFTPEGVVKSLIFFNCFTIFFKIITSYNKSWLNILFLLLCLFQAQIFALQLVTIRQGLGLAVLLWVMPKIRNKFQFVLLLAILGTIHNSFFIIALFTGIYYLLENYNIRSEKSRIILLSLFGFLFNLLLFVFLSFFSTKQAGGYEDLNLQTGGGGFLMWGFMFVYLFFYKKKRIEYSNMIKIIFEFSVIGLIIYLTSYFLTPIAGRIIGAFFPFIFFLLLYKMNLEDLLIAILFLTINFYLFINGGAEGFLEVKLDELINSIVNYIT